MAKVFVEFEYDAKELGPKWFNKDNLMLLIYGKSSTKRDLLKINSFREKLEPEMAYLDKEGNQMNYRTMICQICHKPFTGHSSDVVCSNESCRKEMKHVG